MDLYAHQRKIVAENPEYAGLWLGTGAGKTRTALALARGTVLVICPKTQKEDGNWEREAQHLKFGGAMLTKLDTISKETFRRDAATLKGYDTVIVDEAHTCLGVTPNTRQRKRVVIPKASQLFEALDDYIERTKPKRLYLCTATIVKNPMTVWGAKKLLERNPHAIDWIADFYKWRSTFYVKLPMPGRDVYAPKHDKESKEYLASIVKSLGYIGRLEDFFDVPDQTFRTEYIELTAAQKKAVKGLSLEYPDPIVRIGKQHQIENGCLAGDEFTREKRFSNNKTARIIELAEEFPRMVVFAKYRAQISEIELALAANGFKYWTLTGDTRDRDVIIKEASEEDGVFICQAQISAGWELPQTPVMVFASRTYSWVDYEQALGRIQRANAIKKNLYISLVVKGGIDEAVDRSLAHKQDFNEKLYATPD